MLAALVAITVMASGSPDPEDIPLQAIGTKKVEPTPAVTKPAAPQKERKPIGLLIGPKLGGSFGVAGPLGSAVFAGVEVGYRLPVWRRVLGFSLEATFANPTARRSSLLGSSERTTSLWLSVPLYVSASLDLGPGLLRFLAGPAFEYWEAKSSVVGTAFQFNDRAWSLGAAGIVSYGFVLGPGALGVELRYRYGLPHIAGVSEITHSIGVCAAYVFIL